MSQLVSDLQLLGHTFFSASLATEVFDIECSLLISVIVEFGNDVGGAFDSRRFEDFPFPLEITAFVDDLEVISL
jgi:hypothetical protein